MAVEANYNIFCQADPQFWPKTSSFRAVLAQIACIHGCRLLQKYSKVKISWWERSIKPGMGIVNDFSSKHTICCHADPQIWSKMTNPGATQAQITCAQGCRQLQKHSKVKFGSQARIMTTGMGIVHGILSQPQHFLPSWPPILVKNKQLQGWVSPNDMCKLLKIDAEVF